MAYLGSWKIDDVLTFTTQTHTPSTGADVDADSDPTYRLYENETSTPIVTGTMAKLDDANTTGFYSEAVTLSAANGLEKGKSYNLRVTAIVGGVTGSEVHTFQIEAEVDANVVSDKSGYSLSSSQTFDLTGDITGSLSGSVGSVTGAVGSVTGAVGSVTGAVGSVTAGVTVTTNNDKSGYSLTQSFPTNFASLVISAGGVANADVKYVNAIEVGGSGTSGDPWGPA